MSSPLRSPSPRATRRRVWTAGRRRFALFTLVGTLLSGMVPVILGVPARIEPSQRVDMKLLLLTATGSESGFQEWKAVLDQIGVPYDAKVAADDPEYTDATFADYAANRSRYQGIILTDGDLLACNPFCGSMLAASEWEALAKLQRTFGIRQISDATQPGVAHGLDVWTNIGDQGGNTGQVTPAGKLVFPELVGPVPIEAGSFGYQAKPLPTANFTTLVSGPDGASYAGVNETTDGREELVLTVASNRYQLHHQLLRRGLVNWVTRGVYLGYHRNYFTMHIDDVFDADAKWDPVSNTTPGDLNPPTCGGTGQPACEFVRMTPSDTATALAWQSANGVVFDMAFNGYGVGEARDANGGVDPLSDDPTVGLLRPSVIGQFRWINHTWSHLNFDNATLAEMQAEITQNRTFARLNRIPINSRELVTGEHSGLGSYANQVPPRAPINPDLATALASTGITWVGDDNSAQPAQRPLPSPPATRVALTVPRHPSNVYFNVASRDDQLDEYNHIYVLPPEGACVNTAVTTCRTTPATWDEYVNSEVGIMLDHLLGNDPRPHYAHQSNLVVPGGNGILYGADGQGVLDSLLARYRTYVDPAVAPLTQPTMTDAGTLLQRHANWNAARSSVVAFIQDGRIRVQTPRNITVPITGASIGATYVGQRSGWVSINGAATLVPAQPASVTVPSITGSTTVGALLTAQPGTWNGATPITTIFRWQRCSSTGTNCVTLADSVGPLSGSTYTVTAADAGSRLRVVVLAENHLSSVSQARSAFTGVIAAATRAAAQ